jgi:hypothetical protein
MTLFPVGARIHGDPARRAPNRRRCEAIGSALILLSPLATGCAATPSTALAPTATAAKSYPIHFERPSRVGERSHVVIDSSQDMATKVTRDETVVSDKHEKHTAHYDATSTVVAVDSQNRITRVRYEVKELTADGRRLQASVIDLTRHAKKKDAEILVDGSPASEDVRKVLSSVLKVRVGGASDDDVFGPKAPQPVGAHWSVDGPLAIASFKDDGTDVSSVKGDVWLAGTTNVDGAECLTVRATLEVAGVQVPGMPEGAETEESRGEAEMSATLPIDLRLGRPADHLSMKMSFRIRVPAPQGPPMMVSVQSSESQDDRETAM